MAELSAAEFAKQILAAVKETKPYDKKGSDQFGQLKSMLEKTTANFAENFKKIESYMKSLITASSTSKADKTKESKLLDMKVDAYRGQKLKKYYEKGLKFFEQGMKKGSIYVHDVTSHKLLNSINTQMSGADPFAGIGAALFTPEFYAKIEEAIGEGAKKSLTPEPSATPDTGAGGSSGNMSALDDDADKLAERMSRQALIYDFQFERINKLQGLVSTLEGEIFGLGEKAKALPELLFGGLIRAEVAFVSTAADAAYELGNVTKETRSLLTATEKVEQSVSQTGMDRDDFQQNYLKNLKSGIRNQKEAQKIAITQLNTERQLGFSAGDLNETFRDFALTGRMSQAQISDLGRGMREVAKNTGLTGEALKSAVQSSKAFTDNLKKAAQLTSTASKNVIEATANFQKLGVAEAGGELLKKLTSSTDLLMDSTSKASTFLFMAAGSAGKIGELQKGTLLRTKQGIKDLAAGMENVLKQFGVDSLDAIDQLNDEAKFRLNFQLKTTFGMELGEIRSVIEGIKETGKTFGDRLTDVQKKLSKNITAEEKLAVLEEERRLKTSKSLEVLTALDEAAKGAKDMNQALATFGKRKGDFKADIEALGGTFVDGIDAARTSINTSVKSINEGLMKAGKQQIQIDTSEIEKALQDPTALRELTAKITKGEQELATAQKTQLDPVKQTEQTLKEYNDYFRSWSQSSIVAAMSIFGAIGAGTIATLSIGSTIILKLADIERTLRQFTRKKDEKNKPGMTESFLSRLFGRKDDAGGGGSGTVPPAVNATNSAANAANNVKTPALQGIGNTMLASAAQITAILGPLLLLIAATTLLVAVMIKKFDLKPADIMYASIGLGILLLAAGGIMFALMQGEKESEKQTGGKMFSLKGIGKLAAMAIIFTFAAGAIVSLIGGIFAIVQGVLKSIKFQPGDGLKTAQGLTTLFMISGALFGALVGLFQVVENGSTLFGANIARNVGFMILIALGLYLFGGAIVQFMASLVTFTKSVLDSMQMDVGQIIEVAKKIAAMALVLGVIAGVMLAFAGAVRLVSIMFPQISISMSLAPLASLSLLQFAGIVAIIAVGLLAFALIGYLFGPDLIKNVAIGAGAVAIMSVALLIVAASIIGFAIGLTALASMAGTMEAGVGIAPVAAYELAVFAAIVGIMGLAMMIFAGIVAATQIDIGAIMKAVGITMVIMLAAALIAATLMVGLFGIYLLAGQAFAMGKAAKLIPAVVFTLIKLAFAMGLLIFGMALLVDVVSRSSITLEDILYTSLVIAALALGVGLIGAAVGLGVLGLIALGAAAGPFDVAAKNAGIGLLMIAVGVAILSLGIAALYAASILLTPSILFKVITVFALLTLALLTVAIGAAIGTYALLGIFTAGVLFLAASVLGYLGLHAISLGLWWINSGITEKNKTSGKSLETVVDEALDRIYVLDYLVEVMGELSSSLMFLIPPLIIATIASALVGFWGVLFGIAAVIAFIGLAATALGLVLVNTGIWLIQTPVENLYAKIDFLTKTVPTTFAALAYGFIMMASGLTIISNALVIAALAGVALSLAGFASILPIVSAVGWIGMLVTSLGYAMWASDLEKRADDLKRWSAIFGDVAKIMINMSAALISFSYAMTAFGIAMFFMGGTTIRKNEKTGEETTVIGIILADIFNSLEMMISKLESINLEPEELKRIAEKTQIVGEMMKVMSGVIQTFASTVLPLFQRSIFTLYRQGSTIEQIIDAKKDIEDNLPKAFGVMVVIGEQFAEAVADMGPAINQVDKAKKLGELSKALGEMMTGFANNLPYISKGAKRLVAQSKGEGIFGNYEPVQNTLANGIDAMKLILNTITPKIQSMYVDESLSKKLNVASSVLADLMKSFEALAKIVDMFTSGWISNGALVEFAANKDKYNTDLKNALDAIVMLLTSANTSISGMKNFDALPKKISVMGEATKNMGKALEAFQSNAKIFTSKKLAKDFERIKGDASNPETNVAKNFLDFVFMSFVKPIMDQNANPAKVNKALEVVAGSAKATEAMASVLDKFGKDFGRLFESKNIKKINAMISEVTKDADIGNLGKFISDFMTFIDKNIVAEINKVDFDNILDSQDILAELPKVIDGLVALFRSFGELIRFAQSKELKGAKKDQKTSLDVLKSWTSGAEGKELGKAIADFMKFANDQLLAPIVSVMGTVDLDTMMDASDAMKTISDIIVNLQRAMVSFGELGAMLTKQKGTGSNATTYAKDLQKFMKDLQTPETGKTLGMIPSFFDFISKNLLIPLVEIDTKSEIGPQELKTAAETLELIPKVISGVANMMTTFDQTFGETKVTGTGANQKQVKDFITSATETARFLSAETQDIVYLFDTIAETMIDPIFESSLPPGDVKEAGDAYDALIEMMPKFANFLMEAEANLAGINFAGVQAIFDNMSSIATVENSGLVDTFLAANDYLTELVGTMEGTLEKMTRVMELNSQINDMSAQISATSVNVGTPANTQVGAVPSAPTSATAPMNPSVNATVNNTSVTTGSSNVEEANSAAIASKLSEAVNILSSLLNVAVADSGSGLSGSGGVKKPTAASGFEGGAGSGLGGSSDVTSL